MFIARRTSEWVEKPHYKWIGGDRDELRILMLYLHNVLLLFVMENSHCNTYHGYIYILKLQDCSEVLRNSCLELGFLHYLIGEGDTDNTASLSVKQFNEIDVLTEYDF